MAESKQRMEWLDAMRGFTMILVVSYHVAQQGFLESEKISTSLPFLVLFRMPLFFFVSGFLAYKANAIWTGEFFRGLVWKKVKIQVLPAVVFLGVYVVLRGHGNFWDVFEGYLKSPTKGGYWFTWVLLQMFLIYYAVAALAQKVRSNAPIVLLWFLSLMVYCSLYMPREFGKYWNEPLYMYSSLYQTMKFFHFFLLGNIAHRYWHKVQYIFDSGYFYPILCAVAFFSCADIFVWRTCKYEWTNLPRTVAMYSLMMMVIVFFRHYSSAFTKETAVGRGLQYIGVRTLDVYLLHFILIPCLPMVGDFLDANHPNFVLEVVAAVSVALVVIAFCCLISNIIRISPLYRQYLFGRK